jgi:hypothetical protein
MPFSHSPHVTSCCSALAGFCLIRATANLSSPTDLAIWLVFIAPWLATVRTVELLTTECRLAATVCGRFSRLGTGNPCPLRIPCSLRLGLRHRSHKANQRIPHRLLHRVFRAAVESEPVDHGPDDDALLHEPLDGFDYVVIVAAKAINPADDKGVATSQQIKQALALFALTEPGSNTADPVVCNDVIILDDEAGFASLRQLMAKGLVGGAL